jgi:solute carrier family 25 folate transporter 32
MYRVLGPNIAGNASSWGLYFILCVSLFPSPRDLSDLIYNQLKPRATDDAPDRPLLSFSIPSIFLRINLAYISFLATHVHVPLTILLPRGAMTAIFTNPIWVTNVQTFTAPPNSPTVHLGLGSASPSISVSLFSDHRGPCRRIPQAELTAGAMASSLPTLLTKIAHFCPCLVCFMG